MTVATKKEICQAAYHFYQLCLRSWDWTYPRLSHGEYFDKILKQCLFPGDSFTVGKTEIRDLYSRWREPNRRVYAEIFRLRALNNDNPPPSRSFLLPPQTRKLIYADVIVVASCRAPYVVLGLRRVASPRLNSHPISYLLQPPA